MGFARKWAVFLGLNAVLVAAALGSFRLMQAGKHPGNSETESDLMIMPSHRRCDVVLLGTSHGRIFSRDNNHARVESILGRKVLNLSKGSGAGVMPMRLFLECFYEAGNQAGTLVYFLDPWVFYSPSWNEDNVLGQEEPLRLGFLLKMIRYGFSRDAVYRYVFYKFQHPIVNSKIAGRTPRPGNWDSLSRVDPESVRKRVGILYPDGEDSLRTLRYRRELESLVAMAEAHGTKVVLALPASLLGEMPGTKDLKAYLADLRTRHPVRVEDFTYAIREPGLFYDHDHLNSRGIEALTQRFLKPCLDEMAPLPGLAAASP